MRQGQNDRASVSPRTWPGPTARITTSSSPYYPRFACSSGSRSTWKDASTCRGPVVAFIANNVRPSGGGSYVRLDYVIVIHDGMQVASLRRFKNVQHSLLLRKSS